MPMLISSTLPADTESIVSRVIFNSALLKEGLKRIVL